MTCIIGFIDKKNRQMLIGGDSAGVAGLNITRRKDEKVFAKGNFLIGYTSSFRMGQILRFSFTPPEIKTKDLYKYMCTDFIDEVRKVLKAGGFSVVNNNEEKGGCFLVMIKGHCFQVESDFQVGEALSNFDAVGCGDEYALGAIEGYKASGLDPETIIRRALEIAAKYSGGVCAPFNIVKKYY